MPVGTELDKVMLPVKPERLEMVITSVPELPDTMLVDGELEEIVKSPTLRVTMIKWDMEPAVAFTTRL